MKFSQFSRHTPPSGHVFMFVCEDELLIDESQAVWAGFFEGEWSIEKLSLKEFDAIGIPQLSEWALTPLLFGPSRILMVTNAGKLSKKRIVEIQFFATLEHSSLKIVFVMPGRTGKSKPPFPLIRIDPLQGDDTVRWLSDSFGLSQEVSRYLVDNLGSELLPLKQEVEKLQTYVGKDRLVEESDVDQLVFGSEQYGPFELDDAFLAKNYPKSVRILGAMLDDGVLPLLILAKLVRVWRQIFVAKVLERQGSPADIARAAGVPHWKAGGFASASRRFDWERVVDGFRDLVRADQALKTSSPNPEFYFDVMMWKLIGSGTRAR
jgi:DNA polymerase III delta subunit